MQHESPNRLSVALVLDEGSNVNTELGSYWLYRSLQTDANGAPVVSGFYVRRETVGAQPRDRISLDLTW